VLSVNVTGLQGTLLPRVDGGFNFTPTAGFTGITSFTYTVGDGFGGTDTGLVTIDVRPLAQETVRIGAAPDRQSGTGGQWQAAWSHPLVDIVHKADYTNPGEAWSAATLNGVSPQTLAGGDIFAGDLGVSGQSLATSATRQEIDGREALRFDLDKEATEVTVNVSRFFLNDDGSLFVESGLLRVRDADGNIVAEQSFRAGNAAGTQQVTLTAAEGFTSVELLAGAYSGDSFVFGAYAQADGSFGTAPTTDAAGKPHGSDFTLDWIEFDFPVLGVPQLENPL
jgi:large repetitive protein